MALHSQTIPRLGRPPARAAREAAAHEKLRHELLLLLERHLLLHRHHLREACAVPCTSPNFVAEADKKLRKLFANKIANFDEFFRLENGLLINV